MKYALITGTAFCFVATLLNGIGAYKKGKPTGQWFSMAMVSLLMLLLVVFVEPKN